MSVQKLYAGAKLRETRTRLGLTQKAFAEKLSISLPYLNQMENNHRPISSAVILALVQEFGFDVSELAIGDGERMVTDLREALADPRIPATSNPSNSTQHHRNMLFTVFGSSSAACKGRFLRNIA